MFVALAVLCLGANAGAQRYPSLAVEITPDHPLMIFEVSGVESADPVAYGQGVVQIWRALPEELKPYATLQIAMDGPGEEARQQRYQAALQEVQNAEVPVVIELAGRDARGAYTLSLAEELVRTFPCVKGIQARGLSFDEYYRFGADPALSIPPAAEWLMAATDLAARYGRFIAIQLDGLHWPRLMAHAWAGPLLAKFRECSPYVIPVARHRGAHNPARMGAAMGLWLEGAAGNWGVGATSHWYGDANFLSPGVFGQNPAPSSMPSGLYRAMILNGAMAGACVYVFEPGGDLWYGGDRRHWEGAIRPTLNEIVGQGLIARKKFVCEKAKVAYQLASARTPQDFHLNLRDIDGVLDEGLLIHGAYGMERAGQIPELIPNSGRHYWIPILSPQAPQEVLEGFARIVQPGVVTSVQGWTDLLDRYYRPDGVGTAFICRVGRGVFVMHNRENVRETQSYRIPNIPAPVRGIATERRDDGVLVTWPFREGDFAYKVYRRKGAEGPFALVARDLDERRWLDTEARPEEILTYSVTALTTETELYEGTVDYGECLALSTVESRIAEGATASPLLARDRSRPIHPPGRAVTELQAWWPTFEGVPEQRLAVAKTIVERLEKLDRSFAAEDLDGLLDLYTGDYQGF